MLLLALAQFSVPLNGVDLTVMREQPERMSQAPLWRSVGGKTAGGKTQAELSRSARARSGKKRSNADGMTIALKQMASGDRLAT